MPATENTPAAVENAAASPTNGELKYFKKVVLSTPFFIDHKPVSFEPLDRNFGVLKLPSTDPLLPGLVAAAKMRMGGIVVINQEIYDELKKKLPWNPLAPKLRQHVLQVAPTGPSRKRQPNLGAGAAGVGSQIFSRTGVGSVGGGGTGEGAGTPTPAPAPSPAGQGEYKPETAKKSFRVPVLKKTTDRSFEGGVPDNGPDDE